MDMTISTIWFGCESPSEIYVDIINAIIEKGHETSPRGMHTYELYRVQTVMKDPMKRLVLVPNRKINPFFLVAEALWILSGRADAKYITQFNKGLVNFLDKDSDYFHAPYGERIRKHYYSEKFGGSHLTCSIKAYLYQIDQVAAVVETLRKDPDSRRAVICLWDPYMDTQESNDIPCNDMVFFKIRENKLHMTVLNRSNDAILGFPVTNLFQFSMLMELIANLLEVDVGTYCQYSDSLHLYTTQTIMEDVLAVKYPEWYRAPVLPMKRMSLGSKENTLKNYDDMFLSLIYLVPYLCISDVDKVFPEEIGSFRDFAFYIRSYLSYKERDYDDAYNSLVQVDDFSMFLAGVEFMHRAIKNEEGRKRFAIENVWDSLKYRLRAIAAEGKEDQDVYINPELLSSVEFFLEPKTRHEQ